jgi:CheY-like chemotaxis protein
VHDALSGCGAHFRVFIPHARAASRSGSGALRVAPVGARLLIIDDDSAVRSVVRHQAQRRNWSVIEADCAESALARPKRFADADVVLCDLRMPGMGGARLHDLVARDDPRALQRFVFAAGDLASPESVRFAHACQRPLVPKPFDFAELFDLLARVAETQRGSQPARVPLSESGASVG